MPAFISARRHVAVLFALCVAGAPAVALAQSGLEGRWIGGFHGRSGVVPVEVTFATTAGVTSAEMALPQNGEYGIALRAVRQRGSRVSFELPAAHDHMHFDGRLDDAGRLHGSVRQGATGYSAFELFKLSPLRADERAGLAGTYSWGDDPDQVLLVAPSGDGLIYVDYASGRTGTLYPLSDSRLVGGPTMGTGYPVALSLTFERDGVGSAVGGTLVHDGRTRRLRRTRVYDEEDVAFANGAVRIAGTLLRPATPGPHPALVMIHGSGPVSRDVLRPFADHFARHGVAVLITDKRGTGASTGSWARATFDDLAGDALAGVRYLRSRPDIQPAAIGLHGVSLGGWVAPLAATRSLDVAFVVVESAPALTPREHERLRVESQLRADGFSREDIARALDLMDLKFEVARTGDGWPRLDALLRGAARAAWLAYINPPTSLESLRWHWDHVLGYDPIPVLQRLRVPMLVLYGARDTIVPPGVHRARMERALASAGPHRVTIKVFDKANHGFFEAMTGGRLEQPRLAGFVDGYFEERTSWVLAAVAGALDARAPAVLQ